jgi:hypothetical protein
MTIQETEQENVDESLACFLPPADDLMSKVPVFHGEWDGDGVYVYQAYSPAIGDWAIEHQLFGGPAWKPARMTWIKPSFAWMLYRSGYGLKPGQTRVLKIKLSHETLAHLLSFCKCVDTHKDTDKKMKEEETGRGDGRVQWDPERDLFQPSGREPRRMLRQRSIQIGLAGSLSEYYVNHIISIEDVSELAHRVAAAHRLKKNEDVQTAMEALRSELPVERPYLPQLPKNALCELGMLAGPTATVVAQLGRKGSARARPTILS